MSSHFLLFSRQFSIAVPQESLSKPLITAARVVLWAVILTSSIKPLEIFGPGEQSWSIPPVEDLAFRCLVLVACVFCFGVALLTRRIQNGTLVLMPFLGWTILVAVARQSDFQSAKQIGSYASWILFYGAASALLNQRRDFRLLAIVLSLSVVLSACGGELQHLLGYAPGLGAQWPDADELELYRRHTGSGGILVDAFTPYCAALLLMAASNASRKKQILPWLIALWGTANILRGGIVAFVLGLTWFLVTVPTYIRKRVLPFTMAALLCGGVLFGSTIMDKLRAHGDEVNTSGRLDEWPQLLAWIAESPLLGHGPDADMTLLANSAGGRDLRAPHNELLSTGVNYGVFGDLLLWGPLIAMTLVSLRRSLYRNNERGEQAAAASAILLMISVLSFTDNTLRSPGLMIIALSPAAITGVGRLTLGLHVPDRGFKRVAPQPVSIEV